MTAEFWITTCAIFLGPLVAVVITHFLQRRHDAFQRRLFVFRSLMATRRNPLSSERVQALNLVEVEFAKKKRVMDRFSDLLNTYNELHRWNSENRSVREAVVQEVDDKTALLLKEIGAVLGRKLENLDLLRGGYYPEAFSVLEHQQNEVRAFLLGLSSGNKAIPIVVHDKPSKTIDTQQICPSQIASSDEGTQKE